MSKLLIVNGGGYLDFPKAEVQTNVEPGLMPIIYDCDKQIATAPGWIEREEDFGEAAFHRVYFEDNEPLYPAGIQPVKPCNGCDD
jgi:hypothetical protein